MTIHAEAGPEPVEITVRMLMDHERIKELVETIAEHTPGIEIVLR